MDDTASRILAARARTGDDGAREALLTRHLDGLRAFVRLRAGPVIRAKESCSDLVQSICREVLQDLADFDEGSEAAFKHWLYRAALRKILDRAKFYRREKRDAAREQKHDSAGSDVPDDVCRHYATMFTPSRAAAIREDIMRLESAFDRLSEEQREIITMARVAGLGYPEMAEKLGTSEAYCRTLLSRALARLAREMRSDG